MKLAVYVTLLTLIAISQAHGIVIRHDVSDKKYLELGEQYSSSVAYIGGCVATLVEPKWLLTAAHCMRDEGTNLETALHLEAPYFVEKIFVHPSSDIALIQLQEPVRNGKPVNLYNQTNEIGQAVMLVGNGMFGNGRDGLIVDDGKNRGATNTVIGTTQYNLVFLFDRPETAT